MIIIFSLEIFVLHSEIPFEQQVQVLKKLPDDSRKVIISTSIAESSITVPDVKYVIDFGLTKVFHCDETTNFSSLKIEWASKSNMNQRKGRAGRVSNGFCYRLITREFYIREIKDFPTPAILRQPLDKLILNVKRFSSNMSPKQILSLALTPPPEDKIDRSILHLKEVGALGLFKNGEICMKDNNGNFVSFSGECALKIYHIPHNIDESNPRILIAEILLHSSEIYSHFITSANQSSLLNYLIPASKFTRSDIGNFFSRNFKVIIKFSTIENSQNLAKAVKILFNHGRAIEAETIDPTNHHNGCGIYML
jgi:hypothetical protein